MGSQFYLDRHSSRITYRNNLEKLLIIMHDPINPSHYTSGTIECIEAIEASMSLEAFKGFMKGNVIKYIWRYEHKNGAEDLRKAQWYLSRLADVVEIEASNKEALYEAVKEMGAMEESISECPDGFCPLPGIRQGPSEPMFQPVS